MDFTTEQANQLLQTAKRLDLVGLGGSGMFPRVQLMDSRGYAISGSDVNEGSIIDSLRQMGITVYMGHNAPQVEGADLVVYSAAISKENPELVHAQELGIPTMERSVLLGYVSRLYPNSICIAGTHGKTTATSLITSLLELAGKDPAAVIGGKLPLIGGYGKSGSGDTVVIESCEFARTFLQLSPNIAVLLNVDNDHLDCYGTMEGLKAAFREFVSLARRAIVVNGDDPHSMDVVYGLSQPVLTFGIQQNCDVKAENVTEYKPGFFACDVYYLGEPFAHLELAAPGYHNVYNALAMATCAILCELSGEDAAAAAASFKGAGRRFEILGEYAGATIADDYAHHPTEVAATLSTATKMGYRKVWVVHQPFTYSRTRELLDEFAQVLALADEVVLTPIMGSREVDDGSVCSQDLADKIPGAVVVDGLQQAADYIRANVQPGDLVLTMGCGDVYKAAGMILRP